MSYPRTSERRLIEIYDFSLGDLHKIFIDCGKDKAKYEKKLEELDLALAASIFTQITNDNLFVH